MQKQVILDPAQNVVATGVAIIDMNKFLGSVLEKITLTLGGGAFTRSMITYLCLKANGKIIFESTGANLDATNSYMGGTTDPTILKLDFYDRKGITVNARQAGAIDLSIGSGITSLRMELTIAGATTPTLVGFADVSPPTSDPNEAGIRGLMVRKHKISYTVPAAGTFAVPIPHLDPAGGGSAYRRIYFYTANMTGFKTVREGIAEHELTVLQNQAAQKDNFRVPQAGQVVFDPCQDGQMTGRVWDTRPSVGIRSAQFYATFSGAETITIETEELLGLGAY